MKDKQQIINKPTRRVLWGFPLVLIILALAFPAGAQLRVSEEEKAVFAFFQLVKRTPNYKSWVKTLPSYKQASPETQQDIYDLEETRLKWGFGTFDHEEDFLKIRTQAELLMTTEDGQTTLHFRFPGSSGEEYPYFPYSYADAWIALVVNDLGHFANLPITAEQAAQLQRHMKGAKILPVDMDMRVRATSGDIDTPLLMDGTYFWVMAGDIAHLDFTPTGSDTPIFTYSAPWYMSDTEEDILNLLK